ncbi:MAG: hypothetical protein ACM3WS_08435 [Bacillota bacterium]
MNKHMSWMALAAIIAIPLAGCGNSGGSSGGDSAASAGTTPQAGAAAATGDAFVSAVADVVNSSPDDTEPVAIDTFKPASPDNAEPEPLG